MENNYMKAIFELQKKIDDVKGDIFELKLYHEERAKKIKESQKQIEYLRALREKQIDQADQWLDKADNALSNAIHYLENYESLIETNISK